MKSFGSENYNGPLIINIGRRQAGIRRIEPATVYATFGNLHELERLYEEGYVFGTEEINTAAEYGHLDCLKYMHEHSVGGCSWDVTACFIAAENGHLDCLRYAHENGCQMDDYACFIAAQNGHLDCLRYAHENGCVINEQMFTNVHPHCMQYLREHGF
jgi:hypothetical protein